MSRIRKLAQFVVVLAGISLVAGACSEAVNLPAGGSQTGTPSVNVSDAAAVVTLQYSSFEPAIVTIKAGQSVEWMWNDSPVPHDIYFRQFVAPGRHAVPYTIHSVVQINGTWTQTFARPGIYKYICTVHAGMHGEVIVEAANASGTV